MSKDLVRRLYFNSWVRIPVKFLLTFWVMKIGYDYYQYRSAWRTKGPMPRSCGFMEQSPLNPYIPVPYPHYRTYEQFMNIKHFNVLQNNMTKSICGLSDTFFIYFDAPCRENINGIDRFFLRAKDHSLSEKGKFYFLNQLAQKQGNVPQGVYQQIRKIRESQLEAEDVFVPQL